MSPRAAWRLEDLGFLDVARYSGGLADWRASGLPIEGSAASDLDVAEVARDDVPTCDPREEIGAVRERMDAAGWDTCVVVNERRIVLGRLFAEDLAGVDPRASAEEAMRSGPATYRPDFQGHHLLDPMEERDLETSLVTTSDGVLIGAVRRADLADAVVRRHAAHAKR